MPQIWYHFRQLSKLFSTIIFCDWNTLSTRKNVDRKKKINLILKSIHFLLRSESKIYNIIMSIIFFVYRVINTITVSNRNIYYCSLLFRLPTQNPI